MQTEVLALSSFNVPAQTVLVRKVGALYLKTLFYYLDQFKLPTNPYALEEDGDLNFQVPLPMVFPIEEVRFVLYRDPLDRLVAFYYDELFYTSDRTWTDWRKALSAQGAKFDADCSLKQHQKNIIILLGYIKKITESKGMLKLPDQLAPQYKFLLPAIDLGFEPIDIIRANFEIADILAPFVENSAKILKKVESMVRPISPYNVREIVSNKAVHMHRQLYEGDFELYWAYRDGAA